MLAWRLTSAQASHAHVVGGHHLLFDWKVVALHGVQGRVPQDDPGVLALVLQRQQFLRADGMKRLVGLCDEAGLRVLGGRDALSVLNAVAWKHTRKMTWIKGRSEVETGKQS